MSSKDNRDMHEEISKDEIVISLIFTWNVFNQSYVNGVNILVKIPRTEIRPKARLVNG